MLAKRKFSQKSLGGGNKPILPSLKDTGSPSHQKSVHISESSGKLQRGIKSQIAFAFSSGLEESKNSLKSPHLKISISPRENLNNAILSPSKSDQKSPIILQPLQEEICKLKSIISEKVKDKQESIIQDLAKSSISVRHERKVHDPSVLEKNCLPELISEDEELLNLGESLRQFKEKYEKLEDQYYEETALMRKENQLLQIRTGTLEIECENLRYKIELYSHNQEIKKKNETESEYNKAREDAKNRADEINHYIELLNSSEAEKHKYKDHAEKAEKKMWNFKQIGDDHLIKVKELEKALQTAIRDLENRDSKVISLKLQIKELQSLKASNESLIESQNDLKKVNEDLIQKNRDIQAIFNTYKEKAQEAESSLKLTIEKLSEQKIKESASTILIDKFKLRRTLTFNAKNENLSQDNTEKLFQKINNLEEELNAANDELEKLTKDKIYLKKVIEEKQQIIFQIENSIQNSLELKISELKLTIISELLKYSDHIEASLSQSLNLLKCKSCKSGSRIKYISWPCEHIFCKSCVTFDESCTFCSAPSRILKVSLFKTLFAHINTQQSDVEIVKSILQKKAS